MAHPPVQEVEVRKYVRAQSTGFSTMLMNGRYSVRRSKSVDPLVNASVTSAPSNASRLPKAGMNAPVMRRGVEAEQSDTPDALGNVS